MSKPPKTILYHISSYKEGYPIFLYNKCPILFPITKNSIVGFTVIVESNLFQFRCDIYGIICYPIFTSICVFLVKSAIHKLHHKMKLTFIPKSLLSMTNSRLWRPAKNQTYEYGGVAHGRLIGFAANSDIIGTVAYGGWNI
jgi:hypothetical protein